MKQTETRDRLMLLRDLKDFRVAKGEPDIRDWDVVTADRRRVGEVHELVIDTLQMKVRYLDVEIDKKILGVKESSHVLIPIAGAQLDNDDNRVYLDEIGIEELKALPPYDHRRITDEFEANIASWFRGATRPRTDTPEAPAPAAPAPSQAPPPAQGIDASRDELFSDRRFWGDRRKGREDESYISPVEEQRRRM